MSRSTVDIPLDKFRITCTAEEVADTFAWLLVEMRAALPRLRPDERLVLRKIMAHDSETFTVRDVFPDFSRDSETHKTLRRLRAGQFIRPARTGRWELDEPIEVKPFGRLVWTKCGEESLFGEATAAVDRKPESSEINPSCPSSAAGPTEVILRAEEMADGDNDLIDLFDYARCESNGPMKGQTT